MRESNKNAYMNMENNEVVAAYFEMHNEGDSSISMPFKYLSFLFRKNSELKTMNSFFLKKIFKCKQFNLDYREFMSKIFIYLEQFPEDFNHDNNKKIKNFTNFIT